MDLSSFSPQGYRQPPGIPPYPGIATINSLDILKYGPGFDGLYDHGLTTNPYINSIFEDVNALQAGLFGQSRTGFNPLPAPSPSFALFPNQPPPASDGSSDNNKSGEREEH